MISIYPGVQMRFRRKQVCIVFIYLGHRSSLSSIKNEKKNISLPSPSQHLSMRWSMAAIRNIKLLTPIVVWRCRWKERVNSCLRHLSLKGHDRFGFRNLERLWWTKWQKTKFFRVKEFEGSFQCGGNVEHHCAEREKDVGSQTVRRTECQVSKSPGLLPIYMSFLFLVFPKPWDFVIPIWQMEERGLEKNTKLECQAVSKGRSLNLT